MLLPPTARRGALIFVLLSLLAGCVTGSQYVTARTTPSGEVSHGIALEGGMTADGHELGVFPGALMSYQMRVGLGDYVDVGVRVGPEARLDLKANFLRSDIVDLAVDPNLGIFFIPTHDANAIIVRGGAPLLMDLNVSRRSSLVLYGGPVYAGDLYEGDQSFGANAGLGLQVRITQAFAIQPELSAAFIKPLESLNASAVFAFGIGVLLGPQPSFER